MLKKLFMLFFVLTLVSACASSDTVTVEEDYDVVESSDHANRMNRDVEEVSVPDRVYFGFNKYNISADAAEILDLQAEWLKSDSSINIIVEGHCDERGTREYNLALGERRANAVKDYLIRQGISARRIKTVSYGKERPVFVGTGESVWRKNRVAITVVAR